MSRALGSDCVDVYVQPNDKVGLCTLFGEELTVIVLVLFNPHCAQDLVQLSGKKSIEKRMMNNIGFKWRGTLVRENLRNEITHNFTSLHCYQRSIY